MEQGSFTPLVFSYFGGMSRECSRFFSHTVERRANRRKEPKSKISAWIKAILDFYLNSKYAVAFAGKKNTLKR